MMVLNRRFVNKIATLFFILSVFLAFGTNVKEVQADVSPPGPPSGTNPVPDGENTNVRMVSETVLVEIDADSSLDGLGKVTATFTMRNLGNIDEQMEVRFPLDQTDAWGGICTGPYIFAEPINDLKVAVNGKTVKTQKTYQEITVSGREAPVSLPCWEHFPVSFPIGKDVLIRVTYTTKPYRAEAVYSYSYILITGDEWKDTIGKADITFRVPYELNDSNFISCLPEDCGLNKNAIEWHYEDFDPSSNVMISLLPPPLWQSILTETKNTTKNPNDGAAWGRLAYAYKGSIKESRGFRGDKLGQEMHKRSIDAYQRAITLLPNNADLHYDFADLLCWTILYYPDDTEAWAPCVEQIKQVLDLNPDHEKIKELILNFGPRLDGLIDFSGVKPDYIILTPTTPTATLIPTEEPTQTATVTPLPTTQITKTATATTMPTFTETGTIILTPVPTQIPKEANIPISLGWIVLLCVAVFIVIKFGKR